MPPALLGIASPHEEELEQLLQSIISLGMYLYGCPSLYHATHSKTSFLFPSSLPGIMHASHRSLRVAALRAVLWLASPASKNKDMWPWITNSMASAIGHLSDGELCMILKECQDRLDSPTSSQISFSLVLVRLLLQSAEHYVKYAPSDGTSRLAIDIWDFLLKYHSKLASRAVLDSVLSLLDMHPKIAEGHTTAENGKPYLPPVLLLCVCVCV